MLADLTHLLPTLPAALVLGPMMLPMPRLVFVLAIIATFAVSSFLEHKHGITQSWRFWLVLLVGFEVGRIAHVLQYWPVYQQAPIDILMLWQGGFHVPSGLVAALGSGWFLSRQQHLHTRILWAPVLTGVVLWSLGNALIPISQTDPQQLPNTIVQQLDGQPIALQALAPNQPVVVNLWASWCPPCRREMPTFARAQKTHPGIRFIYVNQGESLATIERYLNQLDVELDFVVADPRALLSNTFSAVGLPMTLFFDAEGQLMHQNFWRTVGSSA